MQHAVINERLSAIKSGEVVPEPITDDWLETFEKANHIIRTGRDTKDNSYNNLGRLNQAAWVGEHIQFLLEEIYRLRAKEAKTAQTDLLSCCQWIAQHVLTANDGGAAWCALRNQHGAQEWVKKLKSAIAEAEVAL